MQGVQLLFNDPGIPSCETCQKYVVDWDWQTHSGSGEIKTFGPPDKRQPRLRGKGESPPCHRCPKKGPQFEHEFLLSGRNFETLIFYQQTKATFGRGLTEEEARDPVVRQNFSILDGIYAKSERALQSGSLAEAIVRLLAQR